MNLVALILLAVTLSLGAAPYQRFVNPAGATILVRVKKGSEIDADKFHGQHGAQKVHQFKYVRWHVVRLPSNDAAAKRALAAYLNSPLFDAVQEDRIVTTQAVPNDPLFNQQWGPVKIEAPLAWDRLTHATNVIIAVCDTGVDFTHPDLAPVAWTGTNGEHGYQAQFGLIRTTTGDQHGHGSHCSGIIGAVGNNGVGVAGLAWSGLRIIDLKFLNETGSGQISDGMLMIEKAVDLKQAGVNIRAINCSWGGGGPDQALADAMQAAGDAGLLIVCAAGNNGGDLDIYQFWPASIPVDQIISVMATDDQDARATFSNYGWFGTDLAAPGVSIYSTVCTGSGSLCDPSGYKFLSGTSMAAPHVTGAAALLFALNPALAPLQVKQLLLSQASLDARNLPCFSGGRLNLNKLVNNPEVLHPFANHPPTLTVNGANAVLNAGQSVRWRANATDPDGDAITYRLQSGFDLSGFGEGVSALFGSHRFAAGTASNDFTLTAAPWAYDDQAWFTFHALDSHAGISSVARTAFVYRDEKARTNLSQFITHWTFQTNAAGWFEHTLSVDTNRLDPQTCSYVFQMDVGPNSWWTFNQVPDGRTNPYFVSVLAVTNATTGRAFVFDRSGNFGVSTTAVIRINPSTYVPRLAFSMSTNRGPAPHTVTFDLTASNPSNRPTSYAVQPWLHQGRVSDMLEGRRNIVLETPGTSAFEVVVFDDQERTSDASLVFLSALPPVPRVEFWLGNATLLGIASNPPYAIRFNPGTNASGSQTIFAKVFRGTNVEMSTPFPVIITNTP